MNTVNLKKLHMTAFGDSAFYTDFFFEERLLDGNAYVRTEDGQAVSAVYVRPITLEIHGAAREIPFFTGVATLPEYRGRGLCRGLMREAADDLKRKGFPYALLHPFSHAFYEALGFETVNYAKMIAGDADAEAVSELLPMGKNDFAEAAALYESLTKGFASRELRPLDEMRSIFREHFGDGGTGYFLGQNGIPKGYVLLYADKGREAVVPSPALLDGHGALRGFEFPEISPSGKPYTMAIALNAFQEEFAKLKNIIMYQKY